MDLFFFRRCRTYHIMGGAAMSITSWHQVGVDWVATDAQGRVRGVLRMFPDNPMPIYKPPSKTMLDRLDAMPSTNAIRWKTHNTEGT